VIVIRFDLFFETTCLKLLLYTALFFAVENNIKYQLHEIINSQIFMVVTCTVKPVLRGHNLDKEKVSSKTGKNNIRKEIQFIEIFYDKKKETF
jgi:hypothetical protein